MKKRVFYLLLLFPLLASAAGAQPLGRIEREFRKTVGTLAGEEMGGRAAESRGDTLAVEYLRDYLDGISGVKLLFNNGIQSFTGQNLLWPAEGLHSSFNVVGLIEGHDPALKNEVIVIGAHYDHLGLESDEPGGEPKVKYGADDNASGTAMVMALARRLARERNRLKHSVMIVFFGAEERGLVGSGYLVGHMPDEVPLERVVCMVNFDMVGRLNPWGGLELYGQGLAKLLNTRHPWAHGEVAPLLFYTEPMNYSDHVPFAARGIPTLMFSNVNRTDLHKSTDTADKINYYGMSLVYRHVLKMLRTIDAMSEISNTL
jgi:hypothetical protein